jgi:serine/threonine protein kinase
MTPQSASIVSMHALVGESIRGIHDGCYTLTDLLGEGAFGAVYRGEQTLWDRTVRRVAIKVSKHPHAAQDRLAEMLADIFVLADAIDEMTDAVARSHLVHIYDMGVWKERQNRAFVVMEFVSGKGLHHVIESYRGRVPENIVRGWALQICQALAALHELVPPVLHRDLKPDNIILGDDGHLRIVDFGLAARLISMGYVAGTAGTVTYMAPETIQAESLPASDVYSVGLILYEALTGRRPFDHLVPPIDLPAGLQSKWLYQQKSKIRVTPPSLENRAVTADLDRVISKCLEFSPSARYLTARDLMKALSSVAGGPDPDDLAALREGRHLKSVGDLPGARHKFEKGLAARSSSKETRFWLLRELGTVTTDLGDPATGAQRLAEAWTLVENSAILTGIQRNDLLEEVALAYERAGNPYQTNTYRKKKR